MTTACKEFFSTESKPGGGEDAEKPTHDDILKQVERELREEQARHDRLIHELGGTLDKMLESEIPDRGEPGNGQGSKE